MLWVWRRAVILGSGCAVCAIDFERVSRIGKDAVAVQEPTNVLRQLFMTVDMSIRTMLNHNPAHLIVNYILQEHGRHSTPSHVKQSIRWIIIHSMDTPRILTCMSCNHTWATREATGPRRCPNHLCRTVNWDRDKLMNRPPRKRRKIVQVGPIKLYEDSIVTQELEYVYVPMEEF